MLIDTHTHLFSEKYEGKNEEVVRRALAAGVGKLFLPNIDRESIDPMYALCKSFPGQCFPMMGLHPGSVGADFREELGHIRAYLFDPAKKNVAVGEIGMDLYWDTTFIEEQREAFTQQVRWAKELHLPVVIHAREAFEEIFAILDRENDDTLSGVFHCFTGTREQGEKVLAYGNFKLGIGGVVTYKKSGLAETLASFSPDDLVLETDSPYLSPVPFRGKTNESSYLLHIAEKVADIYGMPLAEISEITTRNALDLFPLAGDNSTGTTV